MNPMKTFDPSRPAMVRDRLNDRFFEWVPATMEENYRQYAKEWGHGIIAWDGMLLDCWRPMGSIDCVVPIANH